MRTNFNIRTKGGLRSITTKFVVVIVIVVVVLQVLSINPLGGIFHSVVRPILVLERTLKNEVSQYVALLLSKRSLVEDNAKLRDRLKELEPSALLVDALRKENTELKSLHNREESNNIILASVLAKPSVSLYDTIIVDVGSNDEVSKGDLVLAYGDFVIGTITEVYGKSSLVTLFSSGGRKTDVTLGDEHLLVQAIGRGGGNFETQLPRGVEITLGDVIIFPNISTQIFGVVERVIATPADQFQTILFKNPINMNEVRWVEILKSGT